MRLDAGQRGGTCAFYRPDERTLACGPREGSARRRATAELGFGSSPARTQEEEGADGRGPRVSEREGGRGEMERTGLGEGSNGPLGWACRERRRKRKEKMREGLDWAQRKR